MGKVYLNQTTYVCRFPPFSFQLFKFVSLEVSPLPLNGSSLLCKIGRSFGALLFVQGSSVDV